MKKIILVFFAFLSNPVMANDVHNLDGRDPIGDIIVTKMPPPLISPTVQANAQSMTAAVLAARDIRREYRMMRK